jgi:hypothetical protein
MSVTLDHASYINLIKEDKQFGIIEFKDNRKLIVKIKDVVQALFKSLLTIIEKIRDLFNPLNKKHLVPQKTNDGTYTYLNQNLPWSNDQESQGLVICLHGLNGNPSDLKAYANEFKIQYPKSHICSPGIVSNGNCSLKIAAKPILELAKNYSTKFPNNNITIIGTSNGARIGKYVETKMDPNSFNKLFFASIAGVHYGTRLINQLEKIRVPRLLNSDPTLIKEFHWESNSAVKQLEAWHKKQAVWLQEGKSVNHFFCATTEDSSVISLSSSLPFSTLANGSENQYRVYHGESHISIVPKALKDVLDWHKSQF